MVQTVGVIVALEYSSHLKVDHIISYHITEKASSASMNPAIALIPTKPFVALRARDL
jgi:hypothetical protein